MCRGSRRRVHTAVSRLCLALFKCLSKWTPAVTAEQDGERVCKKLIHPGVCFTSLQHKCFKSPMFATIRATKVSKTATVASGFRRLGGFLVTLHLIYTRLKNYRCLSRKKSGYLKYIGRKRKSKPPASAEADFTRTKAEAREYLSFGPRRSHA